jgi:uncharacterized protein YwgA
MNIESLQTLEQELAGFQNRIDTATTNSTLHQLEADMERYKQRIQEIIQEIEGFQERIEKIVTQKGH